MIIKASRATKNWIDEITEKKQKYIDDYNTKKAAWQSQYDSWTEVKNQFDQDIIAELSSILGYDLSAIPEISINISNYSYIFDIRYEYSSGYSQNIRWRYSVSLNNDGNVDSRPDFRAKLDGGYDRQNLNLNKLKECYDILSALESVDFKDICNKVCAEHPEYRQYVTLENPGELDTKEFDTELRRAGILNFVGQDIWVKVEYKVNSRAYDSEKYYIKVLSVSPSGKTCKALCARAYHEPPLGRNISNSWSYSSKYYITQDLRTGGITICDPMETYTTEEMFDENFPGYA